MENGMIMVFAGKVLEKRGIVQSADVQKEISNDPSVNKVIPIEEIDFALGMLVTAGFLEIYNADNTSTTTYWRFIPPTEFKNRGRHA